MANPLLRRLQEENPYVTIMTNPNVLARGHCFANTEIGTIIMSTKGINRKSIISLALHELGHIRCSHFHPKDVLKKEREAWNYARKYAKEHNYPFSEKCAEKALGSYYRSYENSKKALKQQAKETGYLTPTAKMYKLYYEEVWRMIRFSTRKEILESIKSA